jgi:hypothetical protein
LAQRLASDVVSFPNQARHNCLPRLLFCHARVITVPALHCALSSSENAHQDALKFCIALEN